MNAMSCFLSKHMLKIWFFVKSVVVSSYQIATRKKNMYNNFVKLDFKNQHDMEMISESDVSMNTLALYLVSKLLTYNGT